MCVCVCNICSFSCVLCFCFPSFLPPLPFLHLPSVLIQSPLTTVLHASIRLSMMISFAPPFSTCSCILPIFWSATAAARAVFQSLFFSTYSPNPASWRCLSLDVESTSDGSAEAPNAMLSMAADRAGPVALALTLQRIRKTSFGITSSLTRWLFF